MRKREERVKEKEAPVIDIIQEDLEQEEIIADKYTKGPDEVPAENVYVRHVNRNLDKPDIDKPTYG